MTTKLGWKIVKDYGGGEFFGINDEIHKHYQVGNWEIELYLDSSAPFFVFSTWPDAYEYFKFLRKHEWSENKSKTPFYIYHIWPCEYEESKKTFHPKDFIGINYFPKGTVFAHRVRLLDSLDAVNLGNGESETSWLKELGGTAIDGVSKNKIVLKGYSFSIKALKDWVNIASTTTRAEWPIVSPTTFPSKVNDVIYMSWDYASAKFESKIFKRTYITLAELTKLIEEMGKLEV